MMRWFQTSGPRPPRGSKATFQGCRDISRFSLNISFCWGFKPEGSGPALKACVQHWCKDSNICLASKRTLCSQPPSRPLWRDISRLWFFRVLLRTAEIFATFSPHEVTFSTEDSERAVAVKEVSSFLWFSSLHFIFTQECVLAFPAAKSSHRVPSHLCHLAFLCCTLAAASPH